MHTIRLHGPWELLIPGEPPQTVKLPQDWDQMIRESGSFSRKRWVHRPTGLDENTSLSLLLTDVPIRGRVLLDDQPLGEISGSDCELPIVELPVRASLTIEAAATLDATQTPQIALKIVDRR